MGAGLRPPHYFLLQVPIILLTVHIFRRQQKVSAVFYHLHQTSHLWLQVHFSQSTNIFKMIRFIEYESVIVVKLRLTNSWNLTIWHQLPIKWVSSKQPHLMLNTSTRSVILDWWQITWVVIMISEAIFETVHVNRKFWGSLQIDLDWVSGIINCWWSIRGFRHFSLEP